MGERFENLETLNNIHGNKVTERHKEIPQQNQAPTLLRVGDTTNVIKWYEYGNP